MQIEREHVFDVPLAAGFAYITDPANWMSYWPGIVRVEDGLPDARHERHFAPTDGGFRYRLVVEYAPRPGVKGLYDRLLVRRGVDRALRRTIENLERAFPR
jgi:hypothetical protein